jgi:hypothetical protein
VHVALKLAAHVQEAGPLGRAQPLVVRTVEKQLENDFSTLKELIETS